MNTYNAPVEVHCFITLRLSTTAPSRAYATDKLEDYLNEGKRTKGHPLEEQLVVAVRNALHSGATGAVDEDFVRVTLDWVVDCDDFDEEPYPTVVP